MTNKSKSGYNNNYELSYLKELIEDFPCRRKLSVDKAQKLLLTRYLELENRIPEIIQILKEAKFSKENMNKYLLVLNDSEMFSSYFNIMAIGFHNYLFFEVLSNAGEFRKSTDPNGGQIGFGGSDHRIIGNFKYSGSPCNEIENELRNCFSQLKINPDDPLVASVEFYRRYVKIHPFYDGNGRVGRLILTIYNRYHGLYIKWSEIETGSNRSVFIKRLNECHKREGQFIYSKYLNLLVQFFRKFVINVSELS